MLLRMFSSGFFSFILSNIKIFFFLKKKLKFVTGISHSRISGRGVPLPCKRSQSAIDPHTPRLTTNISQLRFPNLSPHTHCNPSILILFLSSFPVHRFCNRNCHYALAQVALFSYFGPGRPRMRDPEARLRFRSTAPFLRQGSDRNKFDRKIMLQYPVLLSPRCNSRAPPHVAAVQGAGGAAHSVDWTESKCRCALEVVVSGLISPVFEMLPSCR
ncbi:hypothetical protein GGI35DRAFT_330327 [Trichoderma velutinum]